MEIKNVDLFLLDMDGTIYLDDYLIDGASEFINELISLKKEYVFLTNNSSKSKKDYIAKLKRLNIPCEEKNIFTSAMATGIYLQTNYPNKKVYLVGTNALKEELENYNVNLVSDNPDIVLVGFDRELKYEKLEKACEFLEKGALFLATNCDLVCPIKDKKFIPDCGLICHMLTVATKKEPYYLGKPNPYMINLLKEKYKTDMEKIAIVGDRLYTDILSGNNAGCMSICVLSGECTTDDIKTSDALPTYVFPSVKEIIKYLK